MSKEPMKYQVGTLRAVGLEAKWGKTRSGTPLLFARNPSATKAHQRDKWWAVDKTMWDQMKKHGIVEGFDGSTILGDYFSVPA